MHMHKGRVIGAVFAFVLDASVPTAQAYEPTLSPAVLHDAYVLGQRNDQTTAEFLDPYAKQTAGTPDGGTPHLSEIEVLTPFAQVVDESRQKLSGGFSEQQALAAYHKRGDTIVIRIRLVLPAAYPDSERGAQAPAVSHDANQTAALRPENFWQKFQFTLKQNGKTIQTKSIHNQPVYTAATKKSPSTLDGQTVWLEYDAKSVANEPISVEVNTPDGKTATTQFDLRALR
jgi:hypothetical protein